MTVLFGAIVTSKCEEGWWRALSYCTIKQKEVYIPNVPEGCTQTDIITKGNVTINTFICKTTV